MIAFYEVSGHWETGRMRFQSGLQLFKEGLSGDLPDSYNVVVGQPAGEAKEKHLML